MSLPDPATTALSAPMVASIAPGVGPLMPSDAVTQRFNDIMNAATPVQAATHSLPTGLPISGMTSVTEPSGLGNKILEGLQSVSSDYSKKWRNIKTDVDEMARQPSAAAMLSVQLGVLEASVLYELVGKGITRSTQNIDTMVRMS